jgi:hypothetical protein
LVADLGVDEEYEDEDDFEDDEDNE